MDTFTQYVVPRIERAEYHLELLRTRKIPHALSHNDFARVERLCERAMEYEDLLVILRSLGGQPGGVIALQLAML